MKDTRIKYCFVIVLFLIAGFAGAQPLDNIDALKPSQLKRYGKNYEKAGDLYGAIEFYSRYYKINMEDIEIAHKLASLYIRTRNYQKARDYYQRCFMSDPRYVEYLFYHAQMQKTTGDYDGANKNFDIFKKQYKGRDLKKLLVSEIDGIKNAQGIKADSQNVVIKHLPKDINKAHIEFSPILKDESTLIFAALREDEVKYYNHEKKPVRKFYVAELKGKEWVFKEELKGPVNNDDYNTGNGSFSPDGKRFYFTRCEVDWQNNVICKIYKSDVNKMQFSEPEEVTIVNDPVFSTTQPTIAVSSKKGDEILYFSSNRPKGKGGYDIWFSIYDSRNQVFTKPRNAGAKINTAASEMTPFYETSTGKLYFSSDGWPGLGGLDIFETMGEKTKWANPKNIGYPVNTSYDDLYYIVSKNKTDAFFTSNRPGGTELHNPTCCDDLYTVVYKDKVILDMSGRIFEKTGDMTDEEFEENDYIKGHLLQGANVSLFLISEEFENPILVANDTTDKFGKYTFYLENNKNYIISAKKDGYFVNRTKFSTVGADIDKRQVKKPLGLVKIPQKAITLSNINYQAAKWELTQNAKEIIDSTLLLLLEDMPDLLIEISSHTDYKGEDAYNLNLSQKRAESVMAYLIRKGIDKKRLVAKGYGENEAFVVTRVAAAKYDFLKEGDVLNEQTIEKIKNRKDKETTLEICRRTEFKVKGSTDKNSVFYIDVK